MKITLLQFSSSLVLARDPLENSQSVGPHCYNQVVKEEAVSQTSSDTEVPVFG